MDTATETTPEVLRARMVERILARQHLTPAVEAALRSVERHRYVPDTPLDDAYADTAVITHTAPDGTSLSCASEPLIVAAMLNALDVQPGHHVLEIPTAWSPCTTTSTSPSTSTRSKTSSTARSSLRGPTPPSTARSPSTGSGCT